MVLSALIFIEMTCEVGLVKLDLESLKWGFLVKNVKKAESTQDFSPPARPQLAFGEWADVSTRLWRADVLAVAS